MSRHPWPHLMAPQPRLSPRHHVAHTAARLRLHGRNDTDVDAVAGPPVCVRPALAIAACVLEKVAVPVGKAGRGPPTRPALGAGAVSARPA